MHSRVTISDEIVKFALYCVYFALNTNKIKKVKELLSSTVIEDKEGRFKSAPPPPHIYIFKEQINK